MVGTAGVSGAVAVLTTTVPDGGVGTPGADPGIVLGILALAGAAVLALVLVFAVILVVQLRPPGQPVAGPDGVLRYQGHLLPAGRLLSLSAETYGQVTVTPYELIWTGDTGQVWRVPIPALVVRPPSGLFGLPGMGIELPGVGAWRLQVSDRRINRFARNSFKSAREARLTRALSHTLLARGAYPAGARPAA